VPVRKPIRTRKDWYSISVDTLRGWGFLLLILTLLGLLYQAYRQWERRALERDSRQALVEVEALLQRLQGDPKIAGDEFRGEYDASRQGLQKARLDFARADFAAALAGASASRKLLQSIVDALNLSSTGSQAQFISIQGEVDYRRGDGANWEEARNRIPLRAGDFVRTSEGGSAEIVFRDGTLYTVRSNTQFIVSPGGAGGKTPGGGPPDQSIRMEYGWVDLNTASRPSKVTTPGAEARVKQDSEAFVTFDKSSNRGRFGAFRGGLELSSQGGLTREVKELQQVVQTGGLLSEPQKLPGRPEPVEPADDRELDLDRVQTLVLAWSPVAGAARYALQVSRNRLFVENLIGVDNRARPRATLGLRGEGTFYWRVAAFTREGFPGPWSKPLKFRVASFKSGGADHPKIPPELDLEDVKSYGSIFIVSGRSNPGARIEVNGELVNVAVDGSFKKTVQLSKEGWSFIEIRARDRWGNETVRRPKVFVEGP
jgi:hypothetical protein